MVHVYMKWYSTSFINGIRQIKTTTGYHYTAISMAKVKKMDNIKCLGKRGAAEILLHVSGDVNRCIHFGKLVEVHMHTLWPAISLSCTYLAGMSINIYQKTCSRLLIAALFIITKKWKLLRWSPTIECKNTSWILHTVEYYTALRMNNLHLHKVTWINPTNYVDQKRPLNSVYVKN